MAGDYGPSKKMDEAISAYTPNVPWARYGEQGTVDFDGAGTSAATPQVAATAALWIQKNRPKYDAYAEPWMRAEAVRAALFEKADSAGTDKEHFGAGRIRAEATVNHVPTGPFTKQPPADAGGAFLDVLLGRGVALGSNAMLNLELAQVLQSTGLEGQLQAVPSVPGGAASLVQQILAIPTISSRLRAALSPGASGPVASEPSRPTTVAGLRPADRLNLELAKSAPFWRE
jgi:hypothetical protein